MNNDLIFDRGFKIDGLALQTIEDVIKKWTNFHELLMLEKMEFEEETTKWEVRRAQLYNVQGRR